MVEITYLRADGTSRVVLCGTPDPIDAQRLAKASDEDYVKLLNYRRMVGEVYFIR